MLRRSFTSCAIFLCAVSTASAQIYNPPGIRNRAPLTCECSAEREPGLIVIEGLVIDAEVRLSEDGLSAHERQATIFNIAKSNNHKLSGRTHIWHQTNENKCGVTFDYGKKYQISVRTTEEGQLETSSCLIAQTAAFADSP